MKNLFLLILLSIFTFGLKAHPTKFSKTGAYPVNGNESHSFEKNNGQVSGEEAHQVLFFHKEAGMSIFLMPTGIAYQFNHYKKPRNSDNESMAFGKDGRFQIPNYDVDTYRMDMELIGANPSAKVTSHGQSVDYVNYFDGKQIRAHSYNKIVYENIYPNIDWVIYKSENGIKYDFIVKPKGDPNQIKFKAKWVEKITMDESGNLILKNRMGTVQEKSPISFQAKKSIETSFVLEEDIVSFKLAEYDTDDTLVIDPDLIWGSYYGGEGSDGVNSVTTDTQGNVYFCGTTYGSASLASGGFQNNNPATVGGVSAAFLVKFNAEGDRVWATYYGVGFTGGLSVAIDSQDNVYMTGLTYDFNGIAFNGFQNQNAGINDSYIVKFNPAGERLWATYLGGSDGDVGSAIAVDSEDNVYITGTTFSTNFPTINGEQDTGNGSVGVFGDAYLAKFNEAGGLVWSTYFGGPEYDTAFALACDNNGNVFITGRTNSDEISTSDAHQTSYGGGQSDGFLVKYNNIGNLLWSTYYGGSETDELWGCTTDNLGNVFISGETGSLSNIAFEGFQNAPYAPSFMVKFDSNGERLWGTYYGEANGAGPGSGTNVGYACATDSENNVYLAGRTDGTTNTAFEGFQNEYGGGSSDAYIVKFNPLGERIWGTYYGGSDNDGIRGLDVDAANQIYVAGTTQSPNNIFFEGFQNTLENETGFVAKIGCPNPQLLSLPAQICANESLLINPYPGGGTLELFGPGLLSNNTYTAPDVVEDTNVIIQYTTSENSSCPSVMSQFEISVLPNVIASVNVTTDNLNICENDTVAFVANILNAGDSPSIQWFVNNQLVLEDSSTFTSNVLVSDDVIQCTVVSSNVCATPSEAQSNGIILTVNPTPTVNVVFTDLNGGVLVADGGFLSYQWLLNGEPITGANSSTYIPTSNGTYTVTVSNEFGCENSASTFVGVLSLNEENAENLSIYPNPSDGQFTLNFGTMVPEYYSISNPLGKIIFQSSKAKPIEQIDFGNIAAGIYHITYFKNGLKYSEKLVVQK